MNLTVNQGYVGARPTSGAMKLGSLDVDDRGCK